MTYTMVTMKGLVGMTGLSRTTLYHLINRGLIPRGVRMSSRGRAVRYPLEDVREVLSARVAGKSDEEIYALVRRLRAAHLGGGSDK